MVTCFTRFMATILAVPATLATPRSRRDERRPVACGRTETHLVWRMSNQTAIVCAREHARVGPAPVLYLAPRVHHSVHKGLRLSGIADSESRFMPAHKSLFLPYGIGGLIVKRPGALAGAHSAGGAYLRDVEDLDALPHYFDRGPENTRPFRGLLPWLPLQLHGVGAFRDVLDNMLDFAAEAADLLRQIPGIEVPREPELSITLFRASTDDATQGILETLNGSGRFHVSSTTLDERVTIRLAFLHPRTDRAILEDLVSWCDSRTHHPDDTKGCWRCTTTTSSRSSARSTEHGRRNTTSGGCVRAATTGERQRLVTGMSR